MWVVLMLALGIVLFVALPTPAIDAQSQESPYTSPPPDGDGFDLFQPLEGFPVWAQAAIVSAAVSLTVLVLIETARWAWRRWQRGY